VICGGAPLPKGCGQKVVQKFPHIEDFRQGYGMTEMTILIAFEMYGSKHYDCAGQPTPGTKMKVIDIDSGELLSHDQIGEICVTGPTLFKGYHNNLSATQESIDSDNYMHTGDLGYYDSDGHFYIVDRIKTLLKTDGMQVSPTELEGIILTHDSVEEVAVIGIPDEILGEIPTAIVVIKDQYKNTIKCDDLLQYVNGI
jgi:acyl-CoA synthetase (AMP-forming)/AMP-acid ligase II